MTPDTKEQLEQFIAIAEKVKSSRFTKETKNIRLTINFEAGKPLEQEITGFDEESLRSLLIDLRKFTLKKDGAYLPEICDLLIANTNDPNVIKNVQACKDIYDQIMREPTIKMIINSRSETGFGVIKKWFYGHYFHEKQHTHDLENLSYALPTHKTNFVLAVADLIKLSAVVANNAKIILGIPIQ